ncbi:hypothetical protein [Acinetobacter chengduensis]|nr:hypothetical protein [Acinetobacter chengduensis]
MNNELFEIEYTMLASGIYATCGIKRPGILQSFGINLAMVAMLASFLALKAKRLY